MFVTLDILSDSNNQLTNRTFSCRTFCLVPEKKLFKALKYAILLATVLNVCNRKYDLILILNLSLFCHKDIRLWWYNLLCLMLGVVYETRSCWQWTVASACKSWKCWWELMSSNNLIILLTMSFLIMLYIIFCLQSDEWEQKSQTYT